MTTTLQKYKIIFHVPSTHLEACKTAMFNAGAGRYYPPHNISPPINSSSAVPNYTQCCFLSWGVGQFRPSAGANPAIGKVGELERVDEAKVEMIAVNEEVARMAVLALKSTHPYEAVPVEVYKMENF